MASLHSPKTLLSLMASVFFVSVHGHMIMNTPTPYGKSTLNNSPLAADGSDFPCKQRSGVYDTEGASNVFTIGSNYTLSFIGSATHGGGSCQVSLTSDLQPTKSSKWMVIQSIEGGCPADVSGNLGDDATEVDPYKFQYTIPEGIDPGNYTIAWSWVNKVGNREFYMNCGPAMVTGSTSKRANSPITKRATSFPDLFVANLDGVSNGCTTTEGVDILYPDPGNSVQKSSDGTFGPPVGCAASSNSSSSGSSGTTSTVAGSSATSAAGSGFASGAASSSVTSQAATATAITSSPAATSSASPDAGSSSVAAASSSATSSASSSSSTGTSGTMSGSCSDEGEYYCSSDGSSFQRCASGAWSASIAMADGTKCTPGTSSDLSITATKRSLRFSPGQSRVRRSRHPWGI